MIIVGIDTSCDDTCIALVKSDRSILSNLVASQDHSSYGGIVPEIASRSHLQQISELYYKAIRDSNCTIENIDAIAVTMGPGLIGSLIIGSMFAKGLASASKKPLIPVNHLEGHILSVRLSETVDFPFLAVLLSGGHCQIVLAKSAVKYSVISETLDDSLGEVFDKIARELGMGYPGGPLIEEKAKMGDRNAYKFPLPLCGNGNKSQDLSFSGLKTAIKILILQLKKPSTQEIFDICASLQFTSSKIIIFKIKQALEAVMKLYGIKISRIAIVGGVASNKSITKLIDNEFSNQGITTYCPPKKICTDNGAMIAWNAIEMLNINQQSQSNRRALAFSTKSRMPPGSQQRTN